MQTLDTAGAMRYYDRFGLKQDSQLFYEAPALAELVAHADLGDVHDLFELGCGTGRFARELLTGHLPAGARYLGVDLSSTMTGIAHDRLAPFGERAEVVRTDGHSPLPGEDHAFDRFLATYVFDLLPDSDTSRYLAEARRLLRPGGKLALAGITPGVTLVSKLVMGIWSAVFALRPSLVGGCRPGNARDALEAAGWRVEHHAIVVAWGVASEVVVASPPVANEGPGSGARS